MNCTSTVYENRLRHRITMLEDSLAKVSSTRKELHDRVDAVKNEIRETFGQQLNRLRSREQQILEKLDTVASVKDNILSQQQDRLHQALGACSQGLNWLQTAYEDVKHDNLMSVNNVEKRIGEILNQYNSVDFTPRENSYVAFECDLGTLRQAICAFGQIRSSGIVRNSESLPCAMEEYEDEQLEHALSHKSFYHGAKPINVINVIRPTLPHDSKKEWLLKEALTAPTAFNERFTPELKRDSISCQSIDDGYSIKSHRTTQIHNWLHQIKNSVETEPTFFDHFEISKKCTNVNSMDSLDSASKEALFLKYFEKIVLSPDSDWLFGKQAELQVDANEPVKTRIKRQDSVQKEAYIDDVISCTNSSFTTRPNGIQHAESTVSSSVEMVLNEEENLMFAKYAEYWHQFLERLWSSSDSLWLLPCASGDDPVMVPHPDFQSLSLDCEEPMDDDDLVSKSEKNASQRAIGVRQFPNGEARLFAELDPGKSSLGQLDHELWLLKPIDEKSSVKYATRITTAAAVDWLLTVADFRGSDVSAPDPPPPPSNETTAGADDAYGEALGWRAVLEKVHGLGDEKWLMTTAATTTTDRAPSNGSGSVGSASNGFLASVSKPPSEDAFRSVYPVPDLCPF